MPTALFARPCRTKPAVVVDGAPNAHRRRADGVIPYESASLVVGAHHGLAARARRHARRRPAWRARYAQRGLRHGFGVAAVNAGIPLNMVQKWLGHAQLSTKAIYADAVSAEEQAIAARMWDE